MKVQAVVACVCVLIGATEAALGLHEPSIIGFHTNKKNSAPRTQRQTRSTKISFLKELVSGHLLCLYSPVCVGPVRKQRCWFSQEAAHFIVPIGSAMAIKGIKASRKLLEGAKHTGTHGYTREYQKTGGVHEAFQDFMSLGMHEARSFRSWDGSLGKVGQVGDRRIKLISRNPEGKPAIEITKIESTLTPTKIIRDVITYDN